MIAVFIAGAVTIALVALAILLRPLLWRRAFAGPSRQRSNAAVYRDQLARLDQDLADGLLDRDGYERSREELGCRALVDIRLDEPGSQPTRGPRKTMLALALSIPAAATALYLLIGNPGVLVPHSAATATDDEIEQTVARLAARLEQNPSDQRGWAMLGRSYKVLGRMAEAERAYEKAGDVFDNDAQELANYADVAASNANGRFAGKPAQLVDKAMRVDPANPMVLWLAGLAARERGDTAGAVRLWERLLGLLPPDSEDAREVKALIERTRGTTR